MNKVCKTCGGFDICIMGHAGRTAECPEWRPKWIPVGEALPEKYETVLCFDGTYVEPGEFLGTLFVDLDKYESSELCGVTHWMPLPEPPKEVIDIEQIEVE